MRLAATRSSTSCAAGGPAEALWAWPPASMQRGPSAASAASALATIDDGSPRIMGPRYGAETVCAPLVDVTVNDASPWRV